MNERDYAEKQMMIISGIEVNVAGYAKFRFENLNPGETRFLIVSEQTFRDIVYEVLVDKLYVPKQTIDVFDTEPIAVDLLDPMTDLAT